MRRRRLGRAAAQVFQRRRCTDLRQLLAECVDLSFSIRTVQRRCARELVRCEVRTPVGNERVPEMDTLKTLDGGHMTFQYLGRPRMA